MLQTLIVPGVGGSEAKHWQSWLHQQLMHSSRIEQENWHAPILSEWIKPVFQFLKAQQNPVEIVAHSFGCLTTLATLAQYPYLAKKVKHLVLVAPANPARFAVDGFAQDTQDSLSAYFKQLKVNVPATMLISENDPWLGFQDAHTWAKIWQVNTVNLGAAGHVNVASGFGAWPDLYQYLISEPCFEKLSHSDINPLFKLAI